MNDYSRGFNSAFVPTGLALAQTNCSAGARRPGDGNGQRDA